jgi:hypothetical protein
VEAGSIAEELGVDLKSSPSEEIDTVFEILEESLYDNDSFHVLVDDIAEVVESRFDYLDNGELVRGKDGWPTMWVFETNSREEFIRLVNTFTSNYSPRFGRLLTPVVDGVRVYGDFAPVWTDKKLKLAIMDGEGLGHTPETISSISTNVTSKFLNSDAVILVDSAKQPMQAGPFAALSSLASRGYESKLIICFTHFDHVTGDNLPNIRERKNQVLASVDNVVVAIGNKLDESITRELRSLLNNRVIFVSGIQEVLSESRKGTKAELQKLLALIEGLMIAPTIIQATPVYDDANLILSIQKSVQQFHQRWQARLKLQRHPTIPPEPWNRIKALTRRLGELGELEYQELRPIADLIQDLLNGFNNFIAKPLKWEPVSVTEESQQQSKARIKQELDGRLKSYISKSLYLERRSEWHDAFVPRGKGSAVVRSRIVQGIYDTVSPIPGETPSSDLNRFLKELRIIVKESIEAAGGKIDIY